MVTDKQLLPLIKPRYVDSREPESIRYELNKIGWETKYMKSGDYSFITCQRHTVGITRKTIDDLCNSIGDKWNKQLDEMLDFFDMNIILIEGSWRQLIDDKIVDGHGITVWGWDTVWNYLRRWFDKGFTFEMTANEGHTIKRLCALYALYQKPYSLSARSHEWTDDRIMAFPSGCRGKTAMDVLGKFRSLKNVAETSISQLKTVKNVGDKKANSIYYHFNKGSDNAKTT